MSREAELIATMTPLIADLAEDGCGAVALAGSRGKRRSDLKSDYDFRVYANAYRGPEVRDSVQWKRFEAAMHDWVAEGFRMDGVWMRSYAGVRRDLDAWISGTA
ncbi:MAG: DNA polymerase beta subunit, partial [Devosia nanyangense]|nr:DNA polymerase beta subunit [Devosia nanyangense]